MAFAALCLPSRLGVLLKSAAGFTGVCQAQTAGCRSNIARVLRRRLERERIVLALGSMSRFAQRATDCLHASCHGTNF